MAEVVNTGLEKIFFNRLREDGPQIFKVEPYFFKNETIRFVYEVLRTEYLKSTDHVVPSFKQIWAMVQLSDTQGKITKEIYKSLFNEDSHEYSKEWLERKFQAWKASNFTKNSLIQSIELIQKMGEVDYDNVMDIVSRIKTNINEIDTMTDDNEDLGDDFDDPESHKQNLSTRKMSTGWASMDKIMTGGWDRSTFSVIMGETNVGKCFKSDTYIKIKNKNTNEIREIHVGDFYELIKNKKS